MQIRIHPTTFCPRPLLPAAVGFTLLATPCLAQQAVELSSPLSAEVLEHQVAAAGPESDWNCLDIGIMETELRVIIPNYRSGDPVYITAMKGLAKDLWREAIFDAGGAIGDALETGQVGGFELAVFEDEMGGSQPAGAFLDALIVGPNANGQLTQLGTLYVFDVESYGDRIQDIEDEMGVAPTQHSVWRGATLFASGTGTSMRMLGLANTLYGNAYGRDEVRLGGSDWFVRDVLEHVGVYVQYGSGHSIGGTLGLGTPKPVPGPLRSVGEYAALADPDCVFGGDLQILNDGSGGAMSADGTSLSGVVFAYGDVSFEGSDVTSALTVVATGSIDLVGGSNELTAATDGLLFLSSSLDPGDAVAVDGSKNKLAGALHGGASEVRVGGSQNVIVGRLVGSSFQVTGGENVFSDGTD